MAGNQDVGGDFCGHRGADGESLWEELAPGVVRRRLPGWDATVGAVAGSSGVLVVDTGSGAEEGVRIRDGLRSLFGAPVTHAVLTHPHFDHVLGTAAFDGAHVYGAHGLAGHLADARGELERDAVRHGMSGEAAADSAARLVVPLHGVSEQLTLDLGGVAVRLVNMGAAHSPYDLAVVVEAGRRPYEGSGGRPQGPAPDGSGDGTGAGARARRVVFCGDLVEESGEPQAGTDASPAHWPRALDRLLELGGEDALYVPGHGAVVGAGFVHAQRDALARRFGRS